MANKYNAAIRRMARDSGQLPHEFLLQMSRGEPVETYTQSPEDPDVLIKRTVVPDLAMRVDAAKACANYFAPKLSIQQVDMTGLSELGDLSVDELQSRLRVVMLQLSQVSPEAIASVLPQLTQGAMH